MEKQVGEYFYHLGMEYKCDYSYSGCDGCAFVDFKKICKNFKCKSHDRNDKVDVIYIPLDFEHDDFIKSLNNENDII